MLYNILLYIYLQIPLTITSTKQTIHFITTPQAYQYQTSRMRFPLIPLTLLLTASPLLASSAPAPATLQPRTNGWSILNFTRSSSSPTDAVTYSLVINNYGTNSNCTIVDNVTPAWYHAWYDVPCKEVGSSPSVNFLVCEEMEGRRRDDSKVEEV